MRTIHKATSTALAFFLLLAYNFCLVECTFAAEEHDHSAKVNDAADHHHGSDENHPQSDPEKHDAASLCCSSLVAVKNISDISTGPKYLKESFSQVVIYEGVAPKLNNGSKYEIEFPPGVSPPAVFLLTHFTHAPPVSL